MNFTLKEVACAVHDAIIIVKEVLRRPGLVYFDDLDLDTQSVIEQQVLFVWNYKKEFVRFEDTPAALYYYTTETLLKQSKAVTPRFFALPEETRLEYILFVNNLEPLLPFIKDPRCV